MESDLRPFQLHPSCFICSSTCFLILSGILRTGWATRWTDSSMCSFNWKSLSFPNPVNLSLNELDVHRQSFYLTNSNSNSLLIVNHTLACIKTINRIIKTKLPQVIKSRVPRSLKIRDAQRKSKCKKTKVLW
jgi:hypothetical protein